MAIRSNLSLAERRASRIKVPIWPVAPKRSRLRGLNDIFLLLLQAMGVILRQDNDCDPSKEVRCHGQRHQLGGRVCHPLLTVARQAVAMYPNVMAEWSSRG